MQLKLKKTILILFLVLFNNTLLFASSDNSHFDIMKNKVSKWLVNEWNKTVEFQKKEFSKIKNLTNNIKKK